MLLTVLKSQDAACHEWMERILQRDAASRTVEPAVREILGAVQREGDRAVCRLTEEFDGVRLAPEELRVPTEALDTAIASVDASVLAALRRMKARVTEFHREGRRSSWRMKAGNGSVMGQLIRPLDRVGFYVPGGDAAYPSTLLMSIIPAQLAGVQECIIASPPQADGQVNRYVLAAAQLCGVNAIYRMGGAQAIGALAYGTDMIQRVDKIVGPGNNYVDTAKRLVFGTVDIDGPAGPSEVVVLADDSADAKSIAADLLSQAEHDAGATAVLVTPSERLARMVSMQVEQQVEHHQRSTIMRAAITERGGAVVASSLHEAVDIANRIAPEHLEIVVKDAAAIVEEIRHAGMILVGPYAPVPLCDYGAGPNHVLPTGGAARFASPLGVEDFVKRSNLLIAEQSLLESLADDVCLLARAEGFTAHATAVEMRRSRAHA